MPSDRSEETRSLGDVLTKQQNETKKNTGEAVEANCQLSNKTLFALDTAEFLVARGQH